MTEAVCVTCGKPLGRSIYVFSISPECFGCQLQPDETLVEQADRLHPEAMAEARRSLLRGGPIPRRHR